MEKWREIYTEEQIRHLQEIELNTLDVLDKVCSQIGVSFFAYGGTLLGAVRHKGFIPWDDDLDIAMLRSDYERFIEEADNYLPKEYVLQTPYNDKRTPYPYLKLRLKGTKYVEYGYHRIKTEQGIYADIYPIDQLPDDDALYYKQFRKYQRLVKLYAWRQCPYISDSSKSFPFLIKKVVKFCLSRLLLLIPQKFLVRRIDVVAKKYNGENTKRMGNLNYPKPKNLFSSILPFEVGEFNGHLIKLPNGWANHLASRYGDYMQLPPEEQRLGHKPYLLDFGSY